MPTGGQPERNYYKSTTLISYTRRDKTMSPAATQPSASSAAGTSKYSLPSAGSERRGRSGRRRSAQTNSSTDKDKDKDKGRQGLKEGYEDPVSNREDWWRSTIKETPVPGAYELDDFLKEKEKAKITYNFKNEGRKRDPMPHGKGLTLLPGAYAHKDFLQELNKKRLTYNFKSTSRSSQDFLNKGIKDKDVNVSPDRYPMEKYLSCSVEKQPSKHFFFRSQSQRFPPAFYKPREGPPPGAYSTMTASSPMISSSFKSKTPRFSSAHTKVPGPGSYEKTYQSPMPGTIAKMGRQHGLFFACAFH